MSSLNSYQNIIYIPSIPSILPIIPLLPLTRTHTSYCPYCIQRTSTSDPNNRVIPCLFCTKSNIIQKNIKKFLVRKNQNK